MGAWPRVGMLVLIGSMLAMPGSAAADPRQVFLGAPYDDATASAGCVDVLALTGSCVTADATADAETGIFDMELRMRTRDQGASVGVVTGATVASFTSATTRNTPTQAVLGVASLAFDELLLERSGLLPVTTPFQVWAELQLRHATCVGCVGYTRKVLAGGDEAFEAPAPASLMAVMTRPDGGPIPAGVVSARLDIHVETTLAGVGEVHASILGALQHFELATPSLERALGAPYGGAHASRGCNGSAGTTFTCRSSVARSTGRLEMDLDVISPVAGTAPGSGSAIGTASITIDDTPSEPVRARVYVLDLAVDSAEAFVHNATPLIGSATAWVEANANVTGPCDACTGSTGDTVVGVDLGPATRLDDVMHLGIWSREDSDLASADVLTVTFNVYGASSLQNSSGISSALLRSRLSSVRVFEIA